MTLLVFNSLLIVIPVSLGRTLFNALPLLPVTHGIKCNGMVISIQSDGDLITLTLSNNVILGFLHQICMLLSLEAMLFGPVWLELGTALTSSGQGEPDYC